MTALLRKPTAFVPLLMSASALATIAIYVVRFGTAAQSDEGTAAHLWQLLMAGQLPVIAFFALRWLPAEPRRALGVLGVQFVAGIAAAFPVWYFRW